MNTSETQPGEHEQQPESREQEVRNVDVMLGDISASGKVYVDSDGSVQFAEDLYDHMPTMMESYSIQPLIDAGIVGEPSEYDGNRSCYLLASEGHDGWVSLKKEDLNRAINEGMLKVTVDEDGDIELE
jgi:hypothetical protein